MLERARWQRGALGEPREFDWVGAAHARRISVERAHDLYDQARARDRGPRMEAIYLAMLDADVEARSPHPGKRTLVGEHPDEPVTPTPIAPPLIADPRFQRATRAAQRELFALTIDALAAGRITDPSALSWFPTTGTPGVARPERAASPQRVGDLALRAASHRRAATIFRHELREDTGDLHDPAVHQALDRIRKGHPLPDSIAQEMQSRLGADFHDVKIHTDEVAAHAAAALHANAFTIGHDIFFAAGAFDVSGEAGRRLIAHELTHVIQAQQGRVPVSPTTDVSRPGDALEQEAAVAYDRTSPPRPPSTDPATDVPAAQASPASALLLRDPAKPPAKAPGRNVPWLAWDSKLVIGFLDGMVRAGGKPLSADARKKMERDFKNPGSVLAILMGLREGEAEGALLSLKDNVVGLAQIAEWAFWNLTPAGQLRDTYEWLTDPAGKLTREREKAQRISDFVHGMKQLAVSIAQDSGIAADLGEALGEAAGEYIARLRADFASATPHDKGVMIGKGIGYIAMEIALLFVGPEELIAKVPTAVTRIARGGGKAA